MDVSIIIVNYNTFPLTKAAIESVFEKTEGITYEIILIDNNSPDGSGQELKNFFNEKIVYLQNTENMGFGRANNEAAKIARGRNLFFLNSDTILLNNAVKILSDYLDNNPRVGCCGGNLLNEDGKPTHSFYRYFIPSIFGEINRLFMRLPEKILYGKNYEFNNRKKPLKVAYITGADLMIRKKIFDELNGFDPDFFMYYEETELEYRVKNTNYLIISVPFAQIIHLEDKSCSNNFDKLKKFYSSKEICMKKMHSRITIYIINFLFRFRIITRLFLFTILRNKEKIDLLSEIKIIITPPPTPPPPHQQTHKHHRKQQKQKKKKK
jgi:GT2 family glycosyltransferase